MKSSKHQKYFSHELEILKAQLKDGDTLVAEEYIDAIRIIISIFESQGHSGMSASMYANSLSNMIKNVLLFKPLSPISGLDIEWNDVSGWSGGKMTYQNKRESAVFKDELGNAYYLDAIVFQGEDDFDSFTGTVGGISSCQYIKSFPFRPKKFTVHVYRELHDKNNPKHKECSDIVECGSGTYAYFIKDPTELEAVAEYYDIEKTKYMRTRVL